MEIGLHDVALRRHTTDEAKQLYVRRLPLVEPLFAIIKNRLTRSNSSCGALPTSEWTHVIEVGEHGRARWHIDEPLWSTFNLSI